MTILLVRRLTTSSAGTGARWTLTIFPVASCSQSSVTRSPLAAMVEPQLEGLGLARDLVGDRCRHPPVRPVRIQGSRVPLHARAARVHIGRHVLLRDVVVPGIADAAPGLPPDVSRQHLLHVALAEHPRVDRRRRRLDRRFGGIEPCPDLYVERADQRFQPLLPLPGVIAFSKALAIASSLVAFSPFLAAGADRKTQDDARDRRDSKKLLIASLLLLTTCLFGLPSHQGLFRGGPASPALLRTPPTVPDLLADAADASLRTSGSGDASRPEIEPASVLHHVLLCLQAHAECLLEVVDLLGGGLLSAARLLLDLLLCLR